jgi:isoleucyl-tRNA synthetase
MCGTKKIPPILVLVPRGTNVPPCAKCGHTVFKKEEDILDVWFDSGVSWVSVLQQRPETKGVGRADVMYLEGSDQHRGWFQTSLLPAVALTGEPPYAKVLTHGFVLDGQGRAMSKSLGNVIAPQELIQKYGADIVRLWVSVTDYREDVRLSQDILDRVIDTYRKIRNTLRFVLGNLGDFVPAQHAVPLDKMEVLDLAALSALIKLVEQVTPFRRPGISPGHGRPGGPFLHQYPVRILSGRAQRRPLLRCPQRPSTTEHPDRLWHMGRTLARALAPLLSFTAEETWQTLAEQGLLAKGDNAESVFLNSFPTEIPLPLGKYFVMGDFCAPNER